MSTLVEEVKEYFVELLSRFEQTTCSFRQPVNLDENEKDSKFYDLLRCVSKHLENEMLLQFATKIIRSINSPKSASPSNYKVFIHRHLLPEWKKDLGQFLAQVQVTKWTLNYLGKKAQLKIRICSSPPLHLFIYYDIDRNGDDTYYDSDDENKELNFKLLLEVPSEDAKDAKDSKRKSDAKGNFTEELSFENLLSIKNQNLGLTDLPLNIWLSCIFQMVVALLSGKQVETAAYRPSFLGNLLQLKYFPKLDNLDRTKSMKSVSNDFIPFELPAAENQYWIPKKNIRAPCYARFRNDEKIARLPLSSQIKKRKQANAGGKVGHWIKIPEKVSELLIYKFGELKSRKEYERIVLETCAFIRNSLLGEFVDYVLGPISSKLQQDAHAFLKMLKFATDLTEIQQHKFVKGNEKWCICINDVISNIGNVDDRIVGEIEYGKNRTTVDIFRRCMLPLFDEKKNLNRLKRMKRSIYHDETRNDKDKKKGSTITQLFHSTPSKSFLTPFVCPLLTDFGHSITHVREFLSWIFILDDELFEGLEFGEKIFGHSTSEIITKIVESINLSNLGELNPVKELPIMKCISINRNLKKFLFAGLKSSTVTNKSSKSTLLTLSMNKGNRLHSDLCNLVLGYAIILADPVLQELELNTSHSDSDRDNSDEDEDDDN